jgi:hypothetical protein
MTSFYMVSLAVARSRCDVGRNRYVAVFLMCGIMLLSVIDLPEQAAKIASPLAPDCKLIVAPVKPDGNCAAAALALACYGDASLQMTLRRLVATHLLTNPGFIEPPTDSTLLSLAESMLRDKEWLGHEFLLATCSLLQITIEVWYYREERPWAHLGHQVPDTTKPLFPFKSKHTVRLFLYVH